MGSSSAATGGGGSGVPDMIRPPKIRRKEKFQESIKNFKPPVVAILEGVTKGVSKYAKESNLKRRKSFIKKQGLTGDDIRMDDAYLSSKEGLAELRKQGYTTVADVSSGRDDGDRGGNQVVQAPTETMATATAPTTAEVSQSAATDAAAPEDDILYRKRKTKRAGRSLTILTSSSGASGGLTLGKPSLLGS